MTEETFGPYRIEQLLGRGGMGEVHRAYDTAHDRFVALKRLSPGYHDDEEYRARFSREARIVARLREPHVIPIHAYGEIDGRLYLDMRLVEGSDLSDVIGEATIEPARAVRIVEQVASALDAAHADGLVHRDVKPSNILMTSGDFVYLVDFGIARSVSPSVTGLTASGSVVGTLDYMAPERFESGPVDGRADVYALACVLFACLSGRRPFTADGTAAQIWAHLNEAPPKASPLNPAVPVALDDVIAKGMAKNPADRYATAGAFARAAARALTAPARAIPPGGPLPPGPSPLASPPGGMPRLTASGPQGRPQLPAPMAPGAQYGPPTPPAFPRVPTGPAPARPSQPVHPQAHPPTRSGAASRAALVGGVLAVVVGIVVTVLIVTNGDRSFGRGTSSVTPTSTTTSTAGPTSRSTTTAAKTTATTKSPQVDALLAALPTAYRTSNSCLPAASDNGAVATVRCANANAPNDPRFPPPTVAEFRLFGDRATQDAYFQTLVTSRGIPRIDERGGCRPKSDPIHYALYYRSTAGARPGEFVTCFLDNGSAEVWWVDTGALTIGALKTPGDINTLDKLDLWWNMRILSVP
ncbi:serine/threonine protein kinase [Lentzea xinjiangensis]|uniref:non-specific serine/threonine protein kinase n=1 Tax=Lentzea xinjiangensis TaxID=402600 RepID=A0A1H9UD20_9PSEU|nr:protein kinase [Lentzea xinjiangensis]SES07148.1 serine/threonine protein kinase [Lentzea xinjiangensis]